MVASPWILVTPASRGIGFEVTRRLLQTTKLPVVATARSNQDDTKAQLLDGLDVEKHRLDVLPLDVKDESTISSAAAFCKDKFSSSPSSSYLHLAYCMPGILHPEKSPSQIDADAALETFAVNTLGPMLVAKHFVPFFPSKRTELLSSSSSTTLPARAIFAIMAARVGSISDNRAGGWYSYRASKAGVMQLARSLDVHLRMASGGKAAAVGLHPGTVKTGLSRRFWDSVPRDKLFDAPFAAERLIDVVAKLDEDAGGRTWDWKGEEILP